MKNGQFDSCAHCAGSGRIPRGEYLRAVREAKGIKLKEIAARLGFTQQYICDIELGRRKPTPEIVKGYGL